LYENISNIIVYLVERGKKTYAEKRIETINSKNMKVYAENTK